MNNLLIQGKKELTEMTNTPDLYNSYGCILEPYQHKIMRWILRILVPLQGYKGFIAEKDFFDDNLARYLGLEKWLSSEPFCRPSIIRTLEEQYKASEHRPIKTVNSTLSQNLLELQQLINLNEIEYSLLEFFILLHSSTHLETASRTLERFAYSDLYRLLHVLLGFSESDIRSFLNKSCLLERSGLLQFGGFDGGAPLRILVTLSSEIFADQILSTKIPPIDLMNKHVTKVQNNPTLTLGDYPSVRNELAIIKNYLKSARQTKRRGVNFYVYGTPGTGKTQLARVLAKTINCDLFEVSHLDEDGDPQKSLSRLKSLSAAQHFLHKSNALIVIDECEDIFNDGGIMFETTAQKNKAWLTRLLEANQVPTIWLSNSPIHDPAITRRFDLVIELKAPSKSQRRELLKRHCSPLGINNTLSHLAESDQLTPAILEKAFDIAALVGAQSGHEHTAPVVETIVCSILDAQGHKVPTRSLGEINLPYDPSLSTCDIELDRLVAGLTRFPSGRILLYGPPGTGKTAFGRWLSDQLDKALITKRCSNLISQYIGKTERNLAQAFQEAKRENAILMIDEVDSFLIDRQLAQHSWEITQVNEMLTQMESFDGIFLATTNLMETIDSAAMRRFDIKLKLGFLTPQVARELLQMVYDYLKLPAPNSREIERLSILQNLTPGDFITVCRQARFHPINSPDEFVTRLTEECQLKPSNNRRPIGFIS